MDERRERDPDTGEHIYVEKQIVGTGIGDIFGKIAAKTGKTAKRVAKGMEKIGEKTGQFFKFALGHFKNIRLRLSEMKSTQKISDRFWLADDWDRQVDLTEIGIPW